MIEFQESLQKKWEEIRESGVDVHNVWNTYLQERGLVKMIYGDYTKEFIKLINSGNRVFIIEDPAANHCYLVFPLRLLYQRG